METEQQTFRLPSCRYQMTMHPHEWGYEWEVKEYDYGSRTWILLDSGDSPHAAAAMSDLSMAVSLLAGGMF